MNRYYTKPYTHVAIYQGHIPIWSYMIMALNTFHGYVHIPIMVKYAYGHMSITTKAFCYNDVVI